MNAVGIALLWCVAQVTLLAAVCGVLYLIVHRLRPAAAAPVVLAGLLTIVLLTALAVVPWPQWQIAWTSRPHESGSPQGDSRALVASNVGWDSVPTGSGQSPNLQKREGLSGAVLWWKALLDEVSRPQPVALEPDWQWPALLAVLMFTAAGAGAAWLALGSLAVRAQRRRSRPVEDTALKELVDTLRAELNCLRQIEVRQSSDLTTAATIGWRRPVILLPALWTAWTAEQRRAVLAHEIAHVRRNDFLAVACGQLGVMLHFYHPLLHWLMSRLRLEQELAADAAAAGVAGGQRAYLLALAELALRQADQPLAWPARTFLPTQSAFLRRIAMLRNTRLRVERVSPIARGLAVGTVLACGLLIAGLRGPGSEERVLAQNAEKTAIAASSDADLKNKELTGIDLSYVPEDAVGIVIVRPAAIFRQPGLSEYGKLLRSNSGLPEPLTEFEQVADVLLKGPGDQGTSGGIKATVYQMARPNKFEWLIPSSPAMEKKEYRGRTYFRRTWDYPVAGYAGRMTSSEVLLRVNDRTLVQSHSDEAIKEFIDAKMGLPTFIEARQWKAFEGDCAAVAIKASELASFVPTPPRRRDGIDAVLQSLLLPLWKNATCCAAGVRVVDKLQFHGIAVTASPDDAAKVAKTVDAGLTLLVNMADAARLAGKTERNAPDEESLAWVLETMESLLGKLQTSCDGNTVRVQGSVSMDVVRKLLPPIDAAPKAAEPSQSVANLKRIALAMHNYNEKYKCLPPAVLYGPGKKTPYSWRVALLPFLNQEALYKHYRFDEPWDGPNNRRLAETRIPVYQVPDEAARSANASYFALVGPGTAFEKKDRGKPGTLPAMPGMAGMGASASGADIAGFAVPTDGVSFIEITDGTSNTILLVEAKRDIPWSKPEDIAYDPNKPIPELGGYFEGGFHAAVCDGSAYFFPKDFPQNTLRTLITRASGEPVDWHALKKILGAGPAWLRE